MSQLGALREHTFKAFVSDGIGLSAEKAQNLHRAYQRCKAFAEQPEGWLLLKGSYGCGKTHLAAAIANRRLELKETVLFVNTPDLLDHLRSTYRPNSPHSYDQRFQQVRDTPLLILDDLGAQNNSDWAQEKLYQIFNHRYNARLPTVVTTNEDIDSIEIRIRSRLSDFGLVQIIPITAPDFRRGGRYHEESDLSSLHLHSDKTFETFSLRTTELLRPQATNLRKAYNLTRTFAEDPQGWIVLNSTAFGNGKTHLAAAVANTYSSRGEKVLFIVVPDLLDHLRSTFSPSVSARLDKRFNEVKTVPLLVLDDLGTESATAWAREKLYQLFNYRFNAKLPTIITTTTQFNQLDQRLASRFYSPLCQFFLLEAPSYRGDMKLRRNRK
ncbi:MAG: ATP-binding protein [Candidatus Promineifilaceae bacterium]